MIKQSVTIDETIKLLNEILNIDNDAISSLIYNRVLCNDELAKHPTVQVGYDTLHGYYKVGLLGILNGLFGVDYEGYGAIGIDILDGRVQRFIRIDNVK